MDKLCEDVNMSEEIEEIEELSVEEVYELSKMLYDAGILMDRLDKNTSSILMQIASDTLDLVNNTRFMKDEIDEIDNLVEELDA